jgi:hypothetical protein
MGGAGKLFVGWNGLFGIAVRLDTSRGGEMGGAGKLFVGGMSCSELRFVEANGGGRRLVTANRGVITREKRRSVRPAGYKSSLRVRIGFAGTMSPGQEIWSDSEVHWADLPSVGQTNAQNST